MFQSLALPAHNRSCRQGFTLIEVLIALVVLSIGLLGSAKLQILALHYSSSSFMRGQAAALTQDMADRMRANQAAVAAGNYDGANPGNYQAPANNGCAETATSAALVCSATQLAAHDAWEWQQSIANILPAGAGTVCTDSVATDGVACDGVGTVYSVTVTWAENVGGVTTAMSHRLRVAP